MLARLRQEWFLFGMVCAIVVSSVLPNLGKSDGWLHLDQLTQFGIALIFFLHGINLSPQKMREGMSNWRLHLLIQVTTFAIYPLIWVVFSHGFNLLFPPALALGFCYLFALPSTVSSSVAMTSLAKGNVPGAIFNASFSSVLGVILTPLIIEQFSTFSGQSIPITNTIISVTKIILIPMIMGQLSRPLLLPILKHYSNITNKVDKWVIISIVLNAFSDSVIEQIWSGFSIKQLFLSIVICLIVLYSITHFIKIMAHIFKFQIDDEIASVFCGTKKTLAAGIPMAKIIFIANPNLGMILLPIMLYHPIQLFYCAVIANKYEKRNSLQTKPANIK
ncbi:bile acid:sodium symporter family protein [Vibrio nitrifigilis]|uniref:Bile acid:sodium symporter n=1 Tax=Vibrio nitrifigilis TaxID=2789781 RepID=A0ABS0GGE6_9VIBR|nr:bile acid:sodium symporter family protein [Vibrio nitrifigilis]MBF9001500.1 bile acid:sodium symporter [Vibrio nitrifigilis]